MQKDKEEIVALSLLSGGLDSQLAVAVLKDQGVRVHAIVFDSPFFLGLPHAKAAAESLNVPLQVVDFTAEIVELLSSAPHGYGSCMNPCIDCHARMLTTAGFILRERGFHFVSTGEVLDQRPMSQTHCSLAVVAAESGIPDLVLRPLSALLLPETEPERRGWVDRQRLLGLSGRGRKAQLQLAESFGLKDFPSPAGGCLLTEPNFCVRLKDLKEHEGLNGRRTAELLRIGRHFRIADRVKLVVGRNENDNAALEGMAELYDLVLRIEGFPGPTGLLPFTADEEQIRMGARICARYGDCPRGEEVTVRVRSSRGVKRVSVVPADSEFAEALRV